MRFGVKMSPTSETLRNATREKILALERENDIELSTVQKILCSIDGQVVTILDVLYGDVNLFILDQHMEKADKSLAEKFDLNEGDEIDVREVIVHKHGRPLIYGLSYIPKDRCSNTVIDKLLNERHTTSRIMIEHSIETRTQLENLSIIKPTATLQNLFHTNEDFLVREYALIHHKKIVIQCKEAYPLSYFKE